MVQPRSNHTSTTRQKIKPALSLVRPHFTGLHQCLQLLIRIFFGLDINVNNSLDHSELTADMIEQAQKNLQSWTDLTLKPSSPGAKIAKNACSGPSPKALTIQNSPTAKSNESKVTKTFHFVANSDKKTATRLRNTLASRSLRQSKVNRIAQLEKELEKQLQETETWQRRAIEAGWKE